MNQPANLSTKVEAKFKKAEQLLAAVDKNAREAVALFALNHPAAYSVDVIAKYNNTLAAQAFNLLRNNLTFSVNLVLNRLWDKSSDTLSIFHLNQLLKGNDVIEAIVQRRRTEQLRILDDPNIKNSPPEEFAAVQQMANRGAENAEKEARLNIAATTKAIDDFICSPLFASLNVLRNKILVHTSEITKLEADAKQTGIVIDPMKIGDEEKILELTIPIVGDLHLLFQDLRISLPRLGEVWNKYAQEFWKVS